MGYRKLENTKNRIEAAALAIGAQDGVQCISARTIAAACDISTHTIYNNFPSMQDLIDVIAQKFDRKHLKNVINLVDDGKTWQEIFDIMIDKLTRDKAGTLYYISYTGLYGFDPTMQNPRAEEFLEVSKKLFDPNGKLSDETLLILWDYVTNTAFYYSDKIIRKYIDDTEQTRRLCCDLIINGVNSVTNK